jgi:hypothetical protein
MHQTGAYNIQLLHSHLRVAEVRYVVTSHRCDEKTDMIVYGTDETILEKKLISLRFSSHK